MPEIPYSEVGYHPEYKQLAAIVGKAKLGQEYWPEWARLQERYGWKLLCRAADRCEPLNRWSANVEAVCIQLAKEESDAQTEWEQRTRRLSATPKPTNGKERAEEFGRILRERGLR